MAAQGGQPGNSPFHRFTVSVSVQSSVAQCEVHRDWARDGSEDKFEGGTGLWRGPSRRAVHWLSCRHDRSRGDSPTRGRLREPIYEAKHRGAEKLDAEKSEKAPAGEERFGGCSCHVSFTPVETGACLARLSPGTVRHEKLCTGPQVKNHQGRLRVLCTCQHQTAAGTCRLTGASPRAQLRSLSVRAVSCKFPVLGPVRPLPLSTLSSLCYS